MPRERRALRRAERLHAASAMHSRAQGGCWKDEERIPDAEHHQRTTREHDCAEQAVAVQQSKDKRGHRRDREERPDDHAAIRHPWVRDSISQHRDDEKSRDQAERGDDHGVTTQAFVEHFPSVAAPE